MKRCSYLHPVSVVITLLLTAFASAQTPSPDAIVPGRVYEILPQYVMRDGKKSWMITGGVTEAACDYFSLNGDHVHFLEGPPRTLESRNPRVSLTLKIAEAGQETRDVSVAPDKIRIIIVNTILQNDDVLGPPTAILSPPQSNTSYTWTIRLTQAQMNEATLCLLPPRTNTAPKR